MIDMIREMWDDGWLGRVVLLVIVAVVAMIPIMIYAGVQEQREWDAFSAAHHCKIVAHMKGDVGVGVGTGVTMEGKVGTGTVVVATPDKTAWKCDDGVTYWR
jgi:hypothetical protein